MKHTRLLSHGAVLYCSEKLKTMADDAVAGSAADDGDDDDNEAHQ